MQHAVKAGIVHADLLRQLLARLGRTGEQVEGKPARGNTTLTLNLLGDGAQFVVVATQQDNAGAIARVVPDRASSLVSHFCAVMPESARHCNRRSGKYSQN